MRKTWTIEIKIDVDPDNKELHDVMRQVVNEAGELIFTKASLLSDKKPPQIAMYSDATFEGTEHFKLGDA